MKKLLRWGAWEGLMRGPGSKEPEVSEMMNSVEILHDEDVTDCLDESVWCSVGNICSASASVLHGVPVGRMWSYFQFTAVTVCVTRRCHFKRETEKQRASSRYDRCSVCTRRWGGGPAQWGSDWISEKPYKAFCCRGPGFADRLGIINILSVGRFVLFCEPRLFSLDCVQVFRLCYSTSAVSCLSVTSSCVTGVILLTSFHSDPSVYLSCVFLCFTFWLQGRCDAPSFKFMGLCIFVKLRH